MVGATGSIPVPPTIRCNENYPVRGPNHSHSCASHPSAKCLSLLDWPLLQEWTASASAEPDEIVELEAEF